MRLVALYCAAVAMLVACTEPAQTPMSTQIPGRAYLYSEIMPPEHMVYVWWGWPAGEDGFRELVVDVSVHNEVDGFDGQHGLYIQLGSGFISDKQFYFGLQTDPPLDPEERDIRDERLIFSRWDCIISPEGPSVICRLALEEAHQAHRPDTSPSSPR